MEFEMTEQRKKIGIVVAAFVGVILVAWMMSGFVETKTVNAYFVPTSVRAGETITLVVEITNNLGKNAHRLIVDLDNSSYDQSVLGFTRTSDDLNFVAEGDIRKFYFEGTILNDEHPGIYHIDVVTNLDGDAQVVRPSLEVTQ